MTQKQDQVRDAYDEMAAQMLEGLTVSELADLLRYNATLEEQAKVPEAQASTSLYMIGPGGSEILCTIRGAYEDQTWERVVRFTKKRIAEGFRPKSKEGSSGYSYSKTEETEGGTVTVSVTPAQTQAPQQSHASDAGGNTFVVGEVTATITGGKARWTMKGGRWVKHGVTCWPEVLEAAGLKLDPMQMYRLDGSMPSLGKWEATYSVKPEPPNYPDKVVSLRKVG